MTLLLSVGHLKNVISSLISIFVENYEIKGNFNKLTDIIRNYRYGVVTVNMK